MKHHRKRFKRRHRHTNPQLIFMHSFMREFLGKTQPLMFRWQLPVTDIWEVF